MIFCWLKLTATVRQHGSIAAKKTKRCCQWESNYSDQRWILVTFLRNKEKYDRSRISITLLLPSSTISFNLSEKHEISSKSLIMQTVQSGRHKSQGHLNQWAHWACAQAPGFFSFWGAPTGCGEINFFKLIILLLMLLHDCTNTSSAYLVSFT